MTTPIAGGVRKIQPGMTYRGGQGITYGAGPSRDTVGAQHICMNVMPMQPGQRAKAHYHQGIETIAYLLEGNCNLYYGDHLEHCLEFAPGDQSYIPADVPHAPFNQSNATCIWLVTHSSGSDQDGLVLTPELDAVLAEKAAAE